MKYTIDCVDTNAGWMYRVVLWQGRVDYIGTRIYARHQDAVKAASSAGATPKETK